MNDSNSKINALNLGRGTWISSAPAGNSSVRAVILILNLSWAGRRAHVTNAKCWSCSPELSSSPCTPELGLFAPEECKKSFLRGIPSLLPCIPILLAGAWVIAWWKKYLFSPAFCWAGLWNQPAEQSHQDKQVLPLSVAAASCPSSWAACWNHTSSFLIAFLFLNPGHFPLPPPSLPCRQLQQAAGDNRVLHQASLPGQKAHPQAGGKCPRGRRDSQTRGTGLSSFSLSHTASVALSERGELGV